MNMYGRYSAAGTRTTKASEMASARLPRIYPALGVQRGRPLTLSYILLLFQARFYAKQTGDAPMGIAIATDRRKKALEKVDARGPPSAAHHRGERASTAARRVHLSLA